MTGKRDRDYVDRMDTEDDEAGPSSGIKKAKFTKTTEDAKLRQTIYNDIICITYFFLRKLINEGETFVLTDLSFMNQVGAAILSCVGYYRKVYSTGKLKVEGVVQSVKIGYKVGTAIMIKTVEIRPVIEEWKTLGLLRHGTDEKARFSYFGSMNSALEFLNLFKLRMNELRLGRSGYFTSSVTGTKAKSVMEHHINPKHVSLLSGITFAPERMSAQLQSLGSLTLLIGMCNQKEKIYTDKYKQAFINSISHIPSSKSIAEYLAVHKKRSKSHIIGLLQGILSAVGDRQSHRLAIPFGVFFRLFSARYITEESNKAAPARKDDIPIACDSSGKGAYAIIKAFQESNDYTYNWGGTSASLSQMIFHAVHDTSCVSFRLLAQTTSNDNWLRRYELTNEFKNNSASPKVKIEMIKLLKVSKMSQAATNNILARGSGTIASSEPRAGYYIREYTKADRELSFAQVGSREVLYTDESTIEQSLEATRKHVWAEIDRQDGKVKHGTTFWYELDVYLAGGGELKDFCPVQCQNNFFNLKPV